MPQTVPNDEFDQATLALLQQQPRGKDPKKRPKSVDAYQLAVEMEKQHPQLADSFVQVADFGGRGSG
jgi:hypothetical protein